jgi:hypothetical protein
MIDIKSVKEKSLDLALTVTTTGLNSVPRPSRMYLMRSTSETGAIMKESSSAVELIC